MSDSPGPPAGHGYPAAPPHTPVPGPSEAPLAFSPEPGVAQGRGPRRRGVVVGLAILGAVLGLAAVAGAGVLAILLLDADEQDAPGVVASEISSTIAELNATTGPADAATSAAGPSEISVLDLSVGTCFDDPRTTEEIESVATVPCNAPHDNEVFALLEHPAGPDASYPGRKPLTEFAEQECQGELFTDFVGIGWRESQYATSQLTPTEGSWAEGDREIICLLYDNAPLTGSVRGSGR